MLWNILAVGAGGFLGSVLRYLIGLIYVNENFIFPIKTFAINIIGSFVLGFVTAYALKNVDLDARLILFLKIGLCGGFTTFSTFALASFDLIRSGNYYVAIIYIIFSVVFSILAVFGAELLVEMN